MIRFILVAAQRGAGSDGGPTAPSGAAHRGGRYRPGVGKGIYFPGSNWGSTYSLCEQSWVLLLQFWCWALPFDKPSPKGPCPAVPLPGERGGCGAGPQGVRGRRRRGREVTAGAADVYVGQRGPAGARLCPGPGFRACGFSRLTGGQWAGARAGVGPGGPRDHFGVWRRLSWAGQTWVSPQPRPRAQGTLKPAGTVIPAAAGTCSVSG